VFLEIAYDVVVVFIGLNQKSFDIDRFVFQITALDCLKTELYKHRQYYSDVTEGALTYSHLNIAHISGLIPEERITCY